MNTLQTFLKSHQKSTLQSNATSHNEKITILILKCFIDLEIYKKKKEKSNGFLVKLIKPV